MLNNGRTDKEPPSTEFDDRIWAWYDVSAEDRLSFKADKIIMLLFVLYGEVAVSDSEGRTMNVGKGGLILKPMDSVVTVRSNVTAVSGSASFSDGSKLVVCRFNVSTSKRVSEFLRNVSGGGENLARFWHFRQATVLAANEHVVQFFSNLVGVLSENSFGGEFCLLKLEEMFMYLKAYFTEEELRQFFRPLAGIDIEFVTCVMDSYKQTTCVSEMASRLMMSRITFSRRFLSSFGVTAAKWLRDMRNRELLKLIVSTDASFTEIAYDMGFSSSAYLTEYCRKNWGKTPTQLRAEGL